MEKHLRLTGWFLYCWLLLFPLSWCCIPWMFLEQSGKINTLTLSSFPIDLVDFWTGPPLESKPYYLKCKVLPWRCVSLSIYIYGEMFFLLSGHGGELYYKRISIKKITVFWKLIILRDLWTGCLSQQCLRSHMRQWVDPLNQYFLLRSLLLLMTLR